MRLYEIMSTEVETVSPAEDAENAWQIMRKRRIHHLIVMDGKRILGVVSDRDLGSANGTAMRNNRTVADLMTPQPVTVNPDTTIRQAANLMRGRAIGCVPVLRADKLVGIVTVSDLLELLGKGLERPVAKRQRRLMTHKPQGRAMPRRA